MQKKRTYSSTFIKNLRAQLTSRGNDKHKRFSFIASVFIGSRARFLKFLGGREKSRQSRDKESSSLTRTYVAKINSMRKSIRTNIRVLSLF
jgi:hypothetical protein